MSGDSDDRSHRTADTWMKSVVIRCAGAFGTRALIANDPNRLDVAAHIIIDASVGAVPESRG
jgi:hypothetical protein